MSTKIDEATAKLEIAQALNVLGADGAWDIAAKVFMKHAARLEKDGVSKEQALQNTLIRLGQECEKLKLENGLFGQALANALSADLITNLGGKGAAESLEELARHVRDQWQPKGKVN